MRPWMKTYLNAEQKDDEAKMTKEKIKEIEAWRKLYPEICEKDGLWQESPKPFYPEEMLVAIRNIEYLLSHIKELEGNIEEIKENHRLYG